MSVYTSVTAAQLTPFLKRYVVGELIDYSGIENGIENSNYRLHTTQGHFILTLYEELDERQIQAVFSLLQQLSAQGLAVPSPQQDRQACLLNHLNGKPAAIFKQLPGQSVLNPTSEHCHRIGQQLAGLHLCSGQSDYNHENPKNLAGCRKLFESCKGHLTTSEIKRISAELAYQQSFDDVELPFGVIHADLFRDNVLWHRGKISGILDFYSSCNDYLLFDIAVTINDWCRDEAFISKEKMCSLLDGYQSVKLLTPLEHKLLPVFLRRAALRFWLSRLSHRLEAKSGALTLDKDPAEFRNILEQHCGLRRRDSVLTG